MCQFAVVHVHGAEFRAAIQGRDRLAGIEQPVPVKGRLDVMKLL